MAAATFKAFAGINNVLPAERLHTLPSRENPAVDLTAATNVDIDDSGQVSLRDGQELKVAGAAHSLWAQGDDCLYVTGSTLKRLYPDYSSETLATGFTVDLPMAYVEVNGRIYLSNGAQTKLIADGRARSWGMEVPPPPGLAALGGHLTAGDYQVALTYLRNDGQESGAGLASVIELGDNAGLRVTWSAPTDATIEQVAVYLSEPNGMVLYRVVVADVEDLFTEVSGGALALPLQTQWFDAPPAGQCLAWHRGRIWIGAGGFLFATTALGYEYVDLRDYLALDGSIVRFVIGVERGLFVATDRHVYYLAGDRLEELNLKTVLDAGGIAGTAVHAEGLAATGLAALAGVKCALFATTEGICLGTPDGAIIHLSRERYRYTATETGAGFFRDAATLAQYLLFLRA